MDEDELRNLLSSISQLAMHGDVPVQAFGALISSARGELIAEHLHQRWLAYPNFAKIAAAIVFQVHGTENRNVTVCTQVLALALRDFRSRRKIRKRSRHMFRNYFRTLVELYPVYRRMDKYLSACLIEPLFRCLQMLVDDSPDDSDLRCVANVMISSGQALNQLNPTECDKSMMKCRKWLASNSVELQETTKYLLFNALDLWTYSWDIQSFPDCLRRFYEEHERSYATLLKQYSQAIDDTSAAQQQVDASASQIFVSAPPKQKLANINSGERRAGSWAPTPMADRRLRRQPSVMDAYFSVATKSADADNSPEEEECHREQNGNISVQIVPLTSEKHVDPLGREESVV